MTDAAVGRLLVASLHQAIAELLPMRLEFYEAWLHPSGLREGRIGLAPLAVVTVKLRQGEYSSSRHEGFKLCTQYWHFLGVVWAILFGALLVAS